MVRVEINLEQLETWGTGTLMGLVLPEVYKTDDKNVTLVFPQTPHSYRVAHGGPKIGVVTEFAIPCLVEDLLGLLAKGIMVSVEMPVK